MNVFFTLSLALVFTVVSSLNASACVPGKGGFLPKNDLFIPADAKSLESGLSETEFNDVIDKVETIYNSIVSSKGGRLNVMRNWNDGTVNAYASRNGSVWNVAMFGGLARHSTVTKDGFALVVCHELGHHIGGSPRKGLTAADSDNSGGWWGGNPGGGVHWASNEGQSDYFATSKCLRRVFLNDNNAKVVNEMSVPEVLKTTCSQSFKSKDDYYICIRTAMAGLSIASLFKALRSMDAELSFTTPDSRVVSRTNDSHPKPQCRLDTYFQGSICEVDFNVDVSESDETVGVCHQANGHKSGLRPRCWFKPAK